MSRYMAAAWRFHHGAVSVPDLDAAAHWYGEMLGFRPEPGTQFTIPDGTKAIFLVRDELRIELFQVTDPAPLPEARRDPRADLRTLGNKHFCFEVDDYDTVVDDLRKKGADIALTVGETYGRGVFLRDNVGNVIEILETRG